MWGKLGDTRAPSNSSKIVNVQPAEQTVRPVTRVVVHPQQIRFLFRLGHEIVRSAWPQDRGISPVATIELVQGHDSVVPPGSNLEPLSGLFLLLR
jgi:hypothetical protein